MGTHASKPEEEDRRSSDSTVPFAGDRRFGTITTITALASSPPTTTIKVSEASPITIHATEGHSNVSRPPPPRRLRHLSELIDPDEIPIHRHIRSPSGNLLGREEFINHPNRPRSIRERQEEIKEKLRTASRLGMMETPAPESKTAQEIEMFELEKGKKAKKAKKEKKDKKTKESKKEKKDKKDKTKKSEQNEKTEPSEDAGQKFSRFSCFKCC